MASFSITTFRKRGVISRVFLSFLMLSVVLLLLFLGFGVMVLNGYYEEQTTSSTRDMLDKAQIASTIAIQQTMESLWQITQNESIISAVAVPDVNNGPRAIEIVNHLRYVQQQSRYIDAIYFYSKFDDAIYCDAGLVDYLPDFFDKKMILAHSNKTDFLKPAERKHYDYFVYGEEVFLIYAFPLSIPYENAVIYARLSKQAIEDILNLGSGKKQEYIQLYSPDHTPILHVEDPVPDWILDQANERPAVVSYPNKKLYYCASPVTGLKYVYSQADIVSHIPWQQILMMLVLLAPLILLCSIFVARNLTEYLYKPIQKMMWTISSSTYDKKPGGEAELEYLAAAMTDLVVRNEDLTRTIVAIQPELEYKLYHSLLTGSLQENDVNEELIHLLQLSEQTHLAVLAVQATDEAYAPLGQIESTMFLLAIRQLLHSYPAKTCRLHTIESDGNTLAVVLVGQGDESAAQIQDEGRRVASFLQGHSGDFSCHLFMALGHTYTGLPSLRTSYTDACQQINYQKYVQDDRSVRIEESPVSFYRNYMLSQLKQVLLYIQEGALDKGEELMDRAMEELFRQFKERNEHSGDIGLYCSDLIDLIIGQLPDVSRMDNIPIDRTMIEQEIRARQQDDGLLEYMKKRYHQFLQIIIRSQSRQQNKYIASAMEYIQSHYTDYTLSLDSVAQQIGIHPNYLSRLFKETMDINFVEYLNKQRIEKAKILLSTTRMTVKDIGFEVGFNSVQNYLRVFKKFENQTPTQYRSSRGKGG